MMYYSDYFYFWVIISPQDITRTYRHKQAEAVEKLTSHTVRQLSTLIMLYHLAPKEQRTSNRHSRWLAG